MDEASVGPVIIVGPQSTSQFPYSFSTSPSTLPFTSSSFHPNDPSSTSEAELFAPQSGTFYDGDLRPINDSLHSLVNSTSFIKNNLSSSSSGVGTNTISSVATDHTSSFSDNHSNSVLDSFYESQPSYDFSSAPDQTNAYGAGPEYVPDKAYGPDRVYDTSYVPDPVYDSEYSPASK